jgi:hypothetical protein
MDFVTDIRSNIGFQFRKTLATCKFTLDVSGANVRCKYTVEAYIRRVDAPSSKPSHCSKHSRKAWFEAYQNSLPKEYCITDHCGVSIDANEYVKEVNRHTSKEVTCESKAHCTGLSEHFPFLGHHRFASHRAGISR